jgi:hypothetical protein
MQIRFDPDFIKYWFNNPLVEANFATIVECINKNEIFDIIQMIKQSSCHFDGKYFYSVDGNIAVGKTHFIEKYLPDNVIAREPLELWNNIVVDDQCSAFEYIYNHSSGLGSSFISIFVFKF